MRLGFGTVPGRGADAPARGVQDALAGPGRPLDDASLAFLEPRLGEGFRDVRIHDDAVAARSARSIHARAYTLGQDVVFGAGQYTPHSSDGRRLLAHELTHVSQQRSGAATIQRAEIDDRKEHCAGLEDATQMIEDEVNGVLWSASSEPDGAVRVDEVYSALGEGSPYSGIENFIEDFPDTHQRRIPINRTKYEFNLSGHQGGSGWINAWLKGEKTVGTVLNLGGMCVGSDKLGHFFQQGRDYFAISTLLGKGDAHAEDFGRWLEGKSSADPVIQAWIDQMNDQGWPGFDSLMLGASFWKGVFGLSTTGVFSPADLAANSAGMAFYKQVYVDPDMTFSLANYLTGNWNEVKNPSCYGPGMAKLVAANDPDFIKEYTTMIRNALKENRMMSAYAGMGAFESILPKYVKKYECAP
jgi:hypothetical protein